MNVNAVIKAIEYCIDEDAPCEGCQMFDKSWCKTELLESAFRLINRQKAEIERLTDFNENLQIINTDLSNEILDIKAEAIKEFAEKLNSHKRMMCGNDNGGLYWDQAVLVDDIDRALKAMTEDKNA